MVPGTDVPADEISSEPRELTVEPDAEGLRLDWFLAQRLPVYSRVRLRRLINAADVKVNGLRVKASHRLRAGERVSMVLPEVVRDGPDPEAIPLDILHEDESLAVINKPPGMVVHPAKGHWRGTLAGALQYHFDQLSHVGGPSRPGIVHRLDRDTSGVIVVAKNDAAHVNLARQFEARTVKKDYLAIVAGVPDRDRDLVDQPIGLHPTQREKMAIRRGLPTSREAVSFYEVVERFRDYALVRIAPRTGRTHQIRVHLGSIGCPVLCDRHYGGRSRITLGELRDSDNETVLLERQALHAHRLAFTHPTTGQWVEFEAPLPDDMAHVLEALRTYRSL